MPQLQPNYRNRTPRILTGALAPGTVIAGSATAYEIVDVGGAAVVAVRAKMAGAGTLKAEWCRPNQDFETAAMGGAVTVPTPLVYTSGNPTNVTVTGGTEAIILPTHSGESWLKITLIDTSGSPNAISYCDVACRTGAGT